MQLAEYISQELYEGIWTASIVFFLAQKGAKKKN